MSKLNPNAKPFNPNQKQLINKVHQPVHRTNKQIVRQVNKSWYDFYGFGDKFMNFYFLNTTTNPFY